MMSLYVHIYDLNTFTITGYYVNYFCEAALNLRLAILYNKSFIDLFLLE